MIRPLLALALVLALASPTAAIEMSAAGGAPTDAKYVTATTNATLTAEQSIGALTTGLLLNTVAAAEGTLSAYGGTSCTNQFPRSLDASGAATCASVANADLAGSIAASKLVGTDIATVGTITTGTWSATAVAADKGGTGQTVYAVGDLLYASTTTALSKLADVATGQVLRSGGVGVAPAWGAITAGDLGTTLVPQFARVGLGVAADATNLVTLAATGVIEWDGRAGIASPAAGILNFTDAAGTGHAIGLGLGTTTPRTVTGPGIAWANSTVIQAYSSGEIARLVSNGVSGGTLYLVDSNGTANRRVALYDMGAVSADVAGIYRITDADAIGATYATFNLSTDAVTLGSTSAVGVTLSPGTGDVVIASGERIGYAVQSATCADSGDANPGALTLQPTSNVITLTNSDANGCNVTMSETAPLAGMPVSIVVISNAGGTVNFADSAGVLEIGTTFSADLDDVLALIYANSAWYAVAQKAN